MHNVLLDQRRSDMMEALYARSGRTCGTFTGLWAEFSHDVANNLRDIDYAELRQACIEAINDSQTVMADVHADRCIAAVRQAILGKWA